MATPDHTEPLPVAEARRRLGLNKTASRQLQPAMAVPFAPMGRPALLYVIVSDNGLLKVGYSVDVKRRLAALQAASAFPLRIYASEAVDGHAAEAERHAHKMLARHRLRGEWFNCHPEEALAAIRKAAFLADNG